MWPMFVAACCSTLLLIGGVCSADSDNMPWWKSVILYQVYPRSFKDSDGDGLGDLRGIIQRSSYLKEVGAGAIFMNPIFKSPMADYGYDISNFREIDPTYGSMADFLELLNVLHNLDIKVLLDLVPNHTSDEHEWFVKSVAREEPYTDYYVWSDGFRDPETNTTRPPNNWLSNFTGIAWEYNEKRQQYYLHQFSVHQPDLNFRNPRVVNEINDVIRYWLDYGIDGWRVDAVPFYFEDCQLRNESALPGTNGDNFQALNHNYTQNLEDTYRITNEWAKIVREYIQKDGKPRLLLMEAYANLSQTVKYYGDCELNFKQPFNFCLQSNGSHETRAEQLRDIILRWMAAIPKNASTNWVLSGIWKHVMGPPQLWLAHIVCQQPPRITRPMTPRPAERAARSQPYIGRVSTGIRSPQQCCRWHLKLWVGEKIGSHDQGRVADRFGVESVDALNMLTCVLPGIKCTYYGEEIGMENTYIRYDQTVDPGGLLRGPGSYQVGSRDPERTPMQWDNSPSAGFSTNYTTWLPVNPNYYYLNVVRQKCDARSHLKVFQDLARARQDPVLKRGSLDVYAPDNDTLLVMRKLNGARFMMVFNMGSFCRNYTSENTFAVYDVDDNYTVNVSSINANVEQGTSFNKGSVHIQLRPRAAALLRTTFSPMAHQSTCS